MAESYLIPGPEETIVKNGKSNYNNQVSGNLDLLYLDFSSS